MTRDFKVIAKSENTNSFGLYQMVVLAKNGMAYKTCASMYNVKNEGDIIQQIFMLNKEGNEVGHLFKGCELTEKIESPPEDVIKETWS